MQLCAVILCISVCLLLHNSLVHFAPNKCPDADLADDAGLDYDHADNEHNANQGCPTCCEGLRKSFAGSSGSRAQIFTELSRLLPGHS